ncbi:MAG TPA: response regulator [Blastocatellia bacterium]|jgi:PAS domain S-box-containing protein|nr:response regulator [Blastocatellia bacterium]
METSKPKILNVDDYEPGLYAKSRALRHAGFEVHEAMNGEVALRLAHELKPQLVLLDVHLPDVSGIEVCRQIKTDPSTASILVVQTSATFTEGSDRVRGFEGGADAYLTEPIEAEELIANVQAMLRLREAEHQAMERAAWLKTVMRSIGDAVITTDLKGGVTSINPVAQHMLGWTEAEAEGRPLTEVFRIVNERTRRSSENPAAGVLREGATAALANYTLLVSRSGEETPVDGTADPIKDERGNVIGVVLIFRDITVRKRMEKAREQLLHYEQVARRRAEEASRSKDEFLATVSHELRTPLNHILGWITMLRSGKLQADKAPKAFDTIERNVRAQARLIDDLLDVSRIISGKLLIEPHRIEIAKVVESAAESIGPVAADKGITFITTLAPESFVVSGDPDRLQQAIGNLLSNAVKFTPVGGQIELRLARVGAEIKITVRDNGQGINPEFLPHVFDRFRQQDATTARRAGGLGLGLAIVRHLVELHGGSVRAESEGEGLGATFTIMLPVADGQAPPSGETPYRPIAGGTEASVPSIDGVRVLLVDDLAEARDLIRFALVNNGAEVRTAASSAEGLSVLAEWRPDVIISDIAMPGEDGYAFIRKVRQLSEESGGTIPAASLTAYVGSTEHVKSLESGYQAYITKPVEWAELITIVASLAGRLV